MTARHAEWIHETLADTNFADADVLAALVLSGLDETSAARYVAIREVYQAEVIPTVGASSSFLYLLSRLLHARPARLGRLLSCRATLFGRGRFLALAAQLKSGADGLAAAMVANTPAAPAPAAAPA